MSMNTDPSMRANFQPVPLPDYASTFGMPAQLGEINSPATESWVSGQCTDFVNNTLGYYAGQQPVQESPPTQATKQDPTVRPSLAMARGTFAQHSGTSVVRRFRDGARETVSTFDDGSKQTTVQLAQRDPWGRPIVVRASEEPQKPTTYEMRLLASGDVTSRIKSEIYRWTDGGRVGKVMSPDGWGEAEPVPPASLMIEAEDITVWTLPGYITHKWGLAKKQSRPENTGGLRGRIRAKIASGTLAVDKFFNDRFGEG